MTYDYLIIGAGWSGATAAYLLARHGKKCLVIEKRSHVGGLSYTEVRRGIVVHAYGPHVFNTCSREIWDFVRQFAELVPFHHTVKAVRGDRVYSFPINLLTLHQVFGVTTPEEARRRVAADCCHDGDPSTIEGYCLATIGRTLYETFIRNYTQKQWGQDPRQLPARLLSRIPIRYTFNDSLYENQFVGLPRGGYTPIFERLLGDCPVELGVDFTQQPGLARRARRIICTMPLDKLCGSILGPLDYRSTVFEHAWSDRPVVQGTQVINYPGPEVPWTRSTEHRFFTPDCQADTTLITREYPHKEGAGVLTYTSLRPDMVDRAQAYRVLLRRQGIYCLGKFGNYEYPNQAEAIAAAVRLVQELEPHA